LVGSKLSTRVKWPKSGSSFDSSVPDELEPVELDELEFEDELEELELEVLELEELEFELDDELDPELEVVNW
jgi:hypothetical protein